MVLCQFFLGGNCRFGTKCFNDHIDLKQIIRTEIESAIKGNQWPMSCFGPFKDKPCIPNFIDDQSFEEIRYQFYEAKVNGNFEQVRQGFINLIQDSKTKMQQLNMLSPEIMNIFVQLYNAGSEQKKVNPAGQSATNAFAVAPNNILNTQGNNQAQNIFGKSNFAATPDPSAANIFGGATPNQQQSTNIFGSGSFAAPIQTPNVFGGGQTQQQQPQQSIFGAATQPGVFGQQVNSFQGANAGSQFALPQVAPQQPAQSVFGAPQPQQSMFGSPTQPQPATNNIFGGQATPFQQPNQPIQSVFAAPANQSPFGGGQQSMFSQQQQPQQPTPVNIFQNQQQPQSIFGQTPQIDPNVAQMRSNVFNQPQQQQPQQPLQQQPQQPQSVFGQAQNNPQSPFQQAPHLQQQPQPVQQSPFTKQQPVQTQPVQTQPVQMQPVQNQPITTGYYDSCYSKLSGLTPEELEAFKSDQFEVGKIPTVPPPKELC